ncbi:MAG: hypothetical protein JWP10_521 [Nocardioidaceae bacterium]|nr:hypothetical protein [Nocardioidaceae bacterium]
MLWRVRTTIDDRPGVLAELARMCGESGVNILGMQVFPAEDGVTDEFVVSAPEGWEDSQIAGLVEACGGERVSVTRVNAASLRDAPTRYLDAAHKIIEDGADLHTTLMELLDTEPPDVATYTGHDTLEVTLRSGETIRISRAIAFTPTERARAQALASLVGDRATHNAPMLPPYTPIDVSPLVRESLLADLDAVAALHERCSNETLYNRYRVPLAMPVTTRFARRLVAPEKGIGLIAQVGLQIVAHGNLAPYEGGFPGQWEFRLLVEDAWQGKGIGTLLIKQAAGRAKTLGARELTFITEGANDAMLRTVGRAGFMARISRRDGDVHITVSTKNVREIQAVN